MSTSFYGAARTVPKPNRASPGNSGYADSQDTPVGAAARPRYLPGHPSRFRRAPTSGNWLSLSCTSPIGTAGLAGLGMEGFGQEPAGQVLSADAGRKKAVGG